MYSPLAYYYFDVGPSWGAVTCVATQIISAARSVLLVPLCFFRRKEQPCDAFAGLVRVNNDLYPGLGTAGGRLFKPDIHLLWLQIAPPSHRDEFLKNFGRRVVELAAGPIPKDVVDAAVAQAIEESREISVATGGLGSFPRCRAQSVSGNRNLELVFVHDCK